MKSANRVAPNPSLEEDGRSYKKTSSPFKKWLRFMASAMALPIGYLILPVSCCVINPMVAVAMDLEESPAQERDQHADPCQWSMEKIGMNLAGMFIGIASCATCCCCCAGCCTLEPNDVF